MEEGQMSKEIFLGILESLDIPFNEGIQIDTINTNPRLVFWDYAWEPIVASGTSYNMICTYQISYFDDTPPKKSKNLIKLLKKLMDLKINPLVSHEYVEKDKVWHSYFSIDLLENILEDV